MTKTEPLDPGLMKAAERLIAYKTAEEHLDTRLLLSDVAALIASGKLLSLLKNHGLTTITRAEYTVFVHSVLMELGTNMQTLAGMGNSQGQSITIIDEPVPQGVLQ